MTTGGGHPETRGVEEPQSGPQTPSGVSSANTRPRYTDEQILGAISEALHRGEMEDVVSLLHVLAVQAPNKASAILDAIKLSSAVGGSQ